MKFAVFILTLITSLNAFANVDTTGIGFGAYNYLNTNYALTIFHNPSHTQEFTAVGLNFSPATSSGNLLLRKPASLSVDWSTADVGVDVYGVYAGQGFSADTIASGSLTYLGNGYSPANPFYLPTFSSLSSTIPRPYSTTGTFYLGFNSGQDFPMYVNGKLNRSIFGWAEFSYDATGITLISSAVTYDQAGIFIGTTNTLPVPESSSSAMLLAGLLMLAFVTIGRRIKKSK